MSRNQMNQPLILPHPGVVLPPSALTVFPYQNSAGLVPALPLMSPQNLLSSPMPASPNLDGAMRYSATSLVSKSPTSPSSTFSSSVKDFRIITWEELKKLFPAPGPDGRVESGLLSDGRAYAQKTARKENYFLFPSKSAYILYFIHYYFSYENLDRDQTFRRMMIESTAVSVDKLIQAPRLASIGTTAVDLQIAITNSDILCLVDLPDGNRGVKRIDGYPGSFSSADTVDRNYSEIKNEMSFENSSLTGNSPPPVQQHSSLERNFVSTSPGEFPKSSSFGLSDALTSTDTVSCNNNSELDAAPLSSPFPCQPYTISSSSQKNSRQVSPGNYSSIAREPSPAVVSAFPTSPATPFSVHSSLQTQGLLLPYSSSYSGPQSSSCAFPQHVSPGNFVGRAPISFDAALSAFLTLSGGNGPAFAHHMTSNGASIQSPSNLHFYCPQLSNGSHVNQNQQLHAYRSLLAAAQSATNPTLTSHTSQSATAQPDVFSTLANFTQFYQQQHNIPRTAGPFQPGQQFYPHQIHLHPQQTGRRNTPPPLPNQQTYYQLAGNQSMHACTPQNAPPHFYSALPVSYSPGFSFANPGIEGGFSAFKSQLPSPPFIQDSVIPHVWNSSEALTAATAGINLQYAGHQQLSALVGGLPLAFDNLSLNCGRAPAIWQQAANSSFIPASAKTPSVDSQVSTSQPPLLTSASSPSPVEVHPCAVDDPSIVAVTDSGDNAQNTGMCLLVQERGGSADGSSLKNAYVHTSKNTKGKHNWPSKFQQPHNVGLINNLPMPSSPIPFFPTASKARPQSALGLPALDLLEDSSLKNKELLLVNDLGISLHSNPD